MSYESDIGKYISKHTGLTGVESRNLFRTMEKKGVDYQTIDFETVGQDMYGHGHRTKGAKDTILKMSGISLYEPEDNSKQFSDMEIHRRQGSRSPGSLKMDNRINAKHTYKTTNEKGVAKWLKKPNRFDLLGIDDML